MYGVRHVAEPASATTSVDIATKRSFSSPTSSRANLRSNSVDIHDAVLGSPPETASVPVVARLSRHTLRIEREYQLFRSFVAAADPECRHTVRVVDLVKLPGRQGDEDRISVSIFELPSRNYLPSLIDFGQAWITPSLQRPFAAETSYKDGELISLPKFFQFAIGACECLELLHHGIRVVHGEIRGDAFHFNRETGAVKFVNFGSGIRTFEGDFSSAGWSRLSKEVGVENKLRFIAPEQTGRMSVEPENRTDIYSLGIVFWVLLTRCIPFEGMKPLDIIHAVLNKKIPSVSSKRMDIPEVVSRIVQKMTQKHIDDRYHSASGLKYDLMDAERLLGEGDSDAAANFKLASKDVSSFFKISTERFGRTQELKRIEDAADKLCVFQHPTARRPRQSNTVSASAASVDFVSLENATRSSDTSSQYTREDEEAKGKYVDGPKPPMESSDSKTSMNSGFTIHSTRSTTVGPNHSQNGFNKKSAALSKCRVITIAGAAGMGKSSLLQDAQIYVRKKGFCAYVKFDGASKAPYEPLRRALSSLFRQIFSESISESGSHSEYHEQIIRSIAGYWPSLCTMLDLPYDLMGGENRSSPQGPSLESSVDAGYSDQHYKNSPRPDAFDSSSIRSLATLSSPQVRGPSQNRPNKVPSRGDSDSTNTDSVPSRGQAKPITSEFPCGGTNTKQIKIKTIFMEVLKVLSVKRLICLCLDDLHAADDESLDLLAKVIEKGLRILMVATCSHDLSIPPIILKALSKNTSISEQIVLNPLNENDAIDLVATTMHRPRESVVPLALVCLEKSNGNPFFFRHMLETAYRKGCIWFTWKEAIWDYDLEKVFAEFKSEHYGQQFSLDCITRRLQELPPTARSILAWASLLGKTFSFSMVQRLLSGEFVEESPPFVSKTCDSKAEIYKPVTAADQVEGLQAALDAFILVPCVDDDCFR